MVWLARADSCFESGKAENLSFFSRIAGDVDAFPRGVSNYDQRATTLRGNIADSESSPPSFAHEETSNRKTSRLCACPGMRSADRRTRSIETNMPSPQATARFVWHSGIIEPLSET